MRHHQDPIPTPRFPRLRAGLAALIVAALLPAAAVAQPASSLAAAQGPDPRVERAAGTVGDALHATRGQLDLTPAQNAKIKSIAGRTDTRSAADLKRARAAIGEVLTPGQSRMVKAWERQSTRDLAAAGIDGDTEGPATFVVCVLICELSCEGDNCNCSYCALTLPIPDP